MSKKLSKALLLRKYLRLELMAYNWNTRRSVVSFPQKVQDSREILKQYLSRNNFNDVAAIDQLMRNVEFQSLPHLNAAIVRAQNSLILSQTLVDLLKNEKGRKEALLKLEQQKELATFKSEQKEARRLQLDTRAELITWAMPVAVADMD